MADVEITFRLPAELAEEASEFGVLTDAVVAALLRHEVDQRIMDIVNEEIRQYRREKTTKTSI